MTDAIAGPVSMQAIQSEAAEVVPATLTDQLMILPVRGTVLFPGMVMPMTVGRERSEEHTSELQSL